MPASAVGGIGSEPIESAPNERKHVPRQFRRRDRVARLQNFRRIRPSQRVWTTRTHIKKIEPICRHDDPLGDLHVSAISIANAMSIRALPSQVGAVTNRSACIDMPCLRDYGPPEAARAKARSVLERCNDD